MIILFTWIELVIVLLAIFVTWGYLLHRSKQIITSLCSCPGARYSSPAAPSPSSSNSSNIYAFSVSPVPTPSLNLAPLSMGFPGEVSPNNLNGHCEQAGNTLQQCHEEDASRSLVGVLSVKDAFDQRPPPAKQVLIGMPPAVRMNIDSRRRHPPDRSTRHRAVRRRARVVRVDPVGPSLDLVVPLRRREHRRGLVGLGSG